MISFWFLRDSRKGLGLAWARWKLWRTKQHFKGFVFRETRKEKVYMCTKWRLLWAKAVEHWWPTIPPETSLFLPSCLFQAVSLNPCKQSAWWKGARTAISVSCRWRTPATGWWLFALRLAPRRARAYTRTSSRTPSRIQRWWLSSTRSRRRTSRTATRGRAGTWPAADTTLA